MKLLEGKLFPLYNQINIFKKIPCVTLFLYKLKINLLTFKVINSFLDVIKKKKFYQILSIILLSLDLICYLTLESLDIGFSAENSRDYNLKLAFYIIKVRNIYIKRL